MTKDVPENTLVGGVPAKVNQGIGMLGRWVIGSLKNSGYKNVPVSKTRPTDEQFERLCLRLRVRRAREFPYGSSLDNIRPPIETADSQVVRP